MGAAGFGEMAAEHFSGGTPYQFAPPDHPLFLLLADIAARHDVPIDQHMNAVPRDGPSAGFVLAFQSLAASREHLGF